MNGGRCAGENCSKQPRFSFPGEKGKFCSKHREEGMVDVLYTVSDSGKNMSADCPYRGTVRGKSEFYIFEVQLKVAVVWAIGSDGNMEQY